MSAVKSVSIVNKKERNEKMEALVARLSKGTFRKTAKVLTKAEASSLDRVNIICKSDNRDLANGVLFFTDDYCMGTHILSKEWVHMSMNTTGTVVARPAFPDGKLKCLDDTIKLYFENYKILESIEEVALHAIATNSYNSEEEEKYSRDGFNKQFVS